ncbi:MAG: hypothetical protein QMD17_14010 [Rhodocyclaceae bacterium]|nr:hypothetical protein [Rhodocyclaceae bacterium]
MTASVIEQILARVHVALLGTTPASTNVYRGRDDAFDQAELPAINIRRTGTGHDRLGDSGERISVGIELDLHVATLGNWETAADALHMAAHAVLVADAPLAALGRGLRCDGTDAQGDSADRVIGKLTARYQMQIFVRPGDFTRAIS